MQGVEVLTVPAEGLIITDHCLMRFTTAVVLTCVTGQIINIGADEIHAASCKLYPLSVKNA